MALAEEMVIGGPNALATRDSYRDQRDWKCSINDTGHSTVASVDRIFSVERDANTFPVGGRKEDARG